MALHVVRDPAELVWHNGGPPVPGEGFQVLAWFHGKGADTSPAVAVLYSLCDDFGRYTWESKDASIVLDWDNPTLGVRRWAWIQWTSTTSTIIETN